MEFETAQCLYFEEKESIVAIIWIVDSEKIIL